MNTHYESSKQEIAYHTQTQAYTSYTLQLPVVAAHKKLYRIYGKIHGQNFKYMSLIYSHSHSCCHYASDDSTYTSTLVSVNATLAAVSWSWSVMISVKSSDTVTTVHVRLGLRVPGLQSDTRLFFHSFSLYIDSHAKKIITYTGAHHKPRVLNVCIYIMNTHWHVANFYHRNSVTKIINDRPKPSKSDIIKP